MQYLMFVVGIVVPIILLTLFFKKKIYLSYNKYICSAIIAVLIALVLEVFTFNFNSFENTRSDKMTVSFRPASTRVTPSEVLKGKR